MCRWLAHIGEPVYVEDLLYAPEHSLIRQSLAAREAKVPVNGDGFGIGWYGTRPEPGLYRDILPVWNDRNLRSLSRQIETRLLFAHVRASTGTATTRANCHPFAFGPWMFMHNGQIGGYEIIRRKLEAMLPDDLYRKREGATDSELFFLLAIANGLETDPEAAILKTIGEVVAIADAAGIEEPFKMTAALSDGSRLYAIRYASNDAAPSLYLHCKDGSTLVVSEPLTGVAAHWTPAPSSVLLAFERPEICTPRETPIPLRP
jgi:glutamine amidotransferase